MCKVDIESWCFWAPFFHPRSPSSKQLLRHQTCELRSHCFPDAERDVRALGRTTAQKSGTRQEDCSSGGKAGLHPPLRSVATCCAFWSNNQATKRLPGWAGQQSPRPVILFELWVLFSPRQAARCRAQHTRDPLQLLKLTLQLCSLSETFLHAHFRCCVHISTVTQFSADSLGCMPTVTEHPELKEKSHSWRDYYSFISFAQCLEWRKGRNQDYPSAIYLE